MRIQPDVVHHVGDGEPEEQPEQGADDPDDRALDQEHPPDRRRGQPHRAEDADLLRLVGHHHGEGPHDVEGGHHHDEENNQSHGQLFELERAEEVRVLGLPVERPIGIAEPPLQRLADDGREVGIGHPDRDARYRGAEAGELLGLLQREHDELIVVLEHPGVEESGHFELPEPGDGHPERRVHLGLGDGHQGDDVARIDPQPAGQAAAQQDAAVHARLAGLEGEVALRDRPREGGDRHLPGVGIEAHHVHAFPVVRARGDTGLADHLRRGGHDPGLLPDDPERLAPVVHAKSGAVGEHPEVRVGDQDALAEIVPQAVHHAEHDDQGRDADGHTAGRDDGVERGGAGAAAAPQVPPGDPPFQLRRHSGRSVASSRRVSPTRLHPSSGRIAGKRITSRIDGWSASTMIRRSMPKPMPPGRGHAVLQRPDVVGVERMGLLVARGALPHLVLEAAPLIVGVVELAECIGQLAAHDEELEPLGERRIDAMLLGQRGERLGVVKHEGRLHQVRLEHDLEHFVLQLAAAEIPDRLGRLPRPEQHLTHLLLRSRAEIEPAALADPLDEAHAPERRGEIQRDPGALDRTGAETVLDHARDDAFRQLHHVGVVGVGLVQLEHRELGIVGPVDALVPEVVADLVHPLEPADEQPLEVQLVGDPQVERHVERVVVRDERPRRRAAVERLEDRGLHLEEVPLVQEPADPADRLRAEPEHLAHLGVHRQVGVALPVAQLGIGEAAEGDGAVIGLPALSPRQRPQRLGQQRDRLGREPSPRPCWCGTAALRHR